MSNSPQMDLRPRTSPGEKIESQDNAVKMSVKNLDFYYGNYHALKNVSLDIIKKKVTAIIGPSGCGKSVNNPGEHRTSGCGSSVGTLWDHWESGQGGDLSGKVQRRIVIGPQRLRLSCPPDLCLRAVVRAGT